MFTNRSLKYQTLATLTYVANMMMIKLSIAVFLLRIATKKRYTWTLKISMGVVTIWSVAILLFDIFQYVPQYLHRLFISCLLRNLIYLLNSHLILILIQMYPHSRTMGLHYR
jgi:hypothetical protein